MTTEELYEHVSDILNKCWKSKGNFFFSLDPCDGHYHLIIHPAIREIYGGPMDGKTAFAGYDFNLGRFIKCFDKKPKTRFISDKGIAFLLLIGSISFVELFVVVAPMPPNNSPTHEVFYTCGPKKGKIETKNLENLEEEK